MKRIMVIGNISAGKSTFAKRLNQLTKIEVTHLDEKFFKPNCEVLPKEEWIEYIQDIIQKEEWIIDGNYPNTLNIRADRADSIFLIDPPRIECYINLIKRNFIKKNNTLQNHKQRCGKFDLKTIKRIWKFKSKRSKYYSDIFAMSNKNIYHFKSLSEVNQYFNSLAKF